MEREIVDTALKNLTQTLGTESTWHKGAPLDGSIELKINGQHHTFIMEVKQEIRALQIPQIAAHCREHANYILVVRQLFPAIKEALKQSNIPYLEANGNMFIKKKGLFLFVDSQKDIPAKKTTGNRAFTKTGLKVVFYLLQHKEAINLTQRDLAEKTGVGLGNIPQVIEGLKETGYLIPLNKKSFVWDKRKELLDRWITAYATTLRPLLEKERYTYQADWQALQFNAGETLWGGEPAADLLTHHLRPEDFLIYTQETRMELIQNYRLLPDPKGEILALQKFWKQDEGSTVPALLVYADLQTEGGKRNLETAEKIYHAYIESDL